jgi:hypothetical protein
VFAGVKVTRVAVVGEIFVAVPVTFVAVMDTMRYLPAAAEVTKYEGEL